jgi:hypothetical protein
MNLTNFMNFNNFITLKTNLFHGLAKECYE